MRHDHQARLRRLEAPTVEQSRFRLIIYDARKREELPEHLAGPGVSIFLPDNGRGPSLPPCGYVVS